MQKIFTILLMTIIVGIASTPILSQDEAFILISDVFAQDYEIPAWIKNNAGWWATNQIDDSTFLLGIQYLIKEVIMIIPHTETSESLGSQEIPSWIKNNAGWWADEQIDDRSFVLGLQWLVANGIIIVEEKLIQTDANLRVAELMAIDFTKVKSITGADLTRASLAYSTLSGVNLDGVIINWTNFYQADLSDQYFRNVVNARILNAIFIEADLSNSNFEGIDFSIQETDKKTLLDPSPEEFLEWLKIPGNSNSSKIMEKLLCREICSHFLNQVFLVSVKIIEDKLVIETMLYNIFSDANLQNANFKNTNLKCADMSNSDLTNANLSGADLTGTLIMNSNLTNTNFDGSILNKTIFDDADIPVENAEITQYLLDCMN